MDPKVSLVGAGPGDAGLLTLKALESIRTADVVVYDRLVSEEVMALIPRGVPKVYAGKNCKEKAIEQQEINQLLITLARKYRHVVRLKGGDPFLFGRGGEEMQALRDARIAYEIIPGITSAQGCAAAVGIPLTHRGLATGIRFITGHRQGHDPKPLDLNWESLADPETTLVVYMGLANIEDLTNNLILHGLDSNTPAAIVENGTTPRQRVISTTLAELPGIAREMQVISPSLIIIGKVAAMAVSEVNSFVTELSYKTTR
jgi:uroporphyrin-III C-methyltransferase